MTKPAVDTAANNAVRPSKNLAAYATREAHDGSMGDSRAFLSKFNEQPDGSYQF